MLTAGTEQWQDRSEAEHLKGSFLVFFPYAFSPGCSAELSALQVAQNHYAAQGVQVIGISCDSHFALRAQVCENKYSFEFLSDFWPHGNFSTACGVFDETAGIARRVTLVVDRKGQILDRFSADISTGRCFADYLDALENFF